MSPSNMLKRVIVLAALFTVAVAQSLEPPLSDTRLTVHTLVREDIFAGFLTDDMDRFARGEKNIETLLETRPTAKSDLLAWKGGAKLYRAVRANESKRDDEFQRYYQQALALFSQASEGNAENGGAAAITGGSYVLFADRLPKEKRADAWAKAYESFQILWKQQGQAIDKLPVHFRGELLGGLATSAQRLGRADEASKYVDKILEVLPGTPYENVAKQWKSNPQAATKTSMTCLNCHESGRLAARLASLNK